MERAGSARIHLCGELVLALDGSPRSGLTRGQMRLLFAYLLLNRERPVTRDELALAIWPEHAPAAYRPALSVLLSRLRRVLGSQAGIEGRAELRLVLPEQTWIDLEAAESSLHEAERALRAGKARLAWAPCNLTLNILGQGLLPGHEAPWLDRRRLDMDELVLRAMECVAAIGLQLGGAELGAAERSARGLIEREPYRESGYLWLMRLHEARGDLAEALRVYEQVRILLREELGSAPTAELQGLYQRLLQLGGAAAEKPLELSAPAAPLPAPLRHTHGFVGRREILEHLGERFEQAQSGEGQMLVIGGEAGIGKTRLCAELAKLAHDRRATVLYGRCDEEMVISYQPFVEALSQHCASSDGKRLREQLGASGDQLARLVPKLRQLLPELPAPPPGSSDSERFHLFEQASSLLASAATDTGLLLILDDLHWADQGTLLMLRHIARNCLSAPLLILGTYRVTEVQPSQPLAGFLADSTRERLAERVSLEGLQREEVGELIAAWSGQESSEQFTATLHAETAGNPFFLGEVLQHLVENGSLELSSGRWRTRVPLSEAGIPRGVQEALNRRLAHLNEATTQMLRRASVLGSKFDLEALKRIGSGSEGELLSLLEQAEQAHLISETAGLIGHYSFSHALIRNALYQSLGATRRARLHEQIGETLEELHRGHLEPHLAELARHFSLAGSATAQRKTIEHSIAAGAHARAQFAFEEAADHFRRAADVLERTEGPAERRLEVLLDLGSAENAGGQSPAAKVSFQQASALAARLAKSEAIARAALGYCGHALELGTVNPESIAMIEQALEAVGPQDSRSRADLLSRLALEVYYTGPERRERLSGEAVAIARRLRDGVALARALTSRRVALAGSADIEQRLAITTELLALAHAAGASEIALWGHTWRCNDLLDMGDVQAAYAEIDAYSALAREFRQPAFLWHISLFAGMRALFEGHLGSIESLIAEGMRIGMRANDPNARNYFGILGFMLRRDQNRLDEIEDEVTRFVERYPAVPAWRCGLTLLYAELGRSAAAQAELERLAEDRFASLPLDINWLPGMAWLAIACGLLEQPDVARDLYHLLEGHSERNVSTGHPIFCLGSVSHYLGVLAAVLDDLRSASAHFERALEMNRAMGARPLLAHTQHEYARALLKLGSPSERERALGLLDEALEAAQTLGLARLTVLASATRQQHTLVHR